MPYPQRAAAGCGLTVPRSRQQTDAAEIRWPIVTRQQRAASGFLRDRNQRRERQMDGVVDQTRIHPQPIDADIRCVTAQ